MTSQPTDIERRALLQSLAGLALVQGAAGSVRSAAAEAPSHPPGRAGEFDFLSGSWSIRHRKRKAAGAAQWDEFEGEATCWSILGGVASVEELRIPARSFSGMGLRLLDVERKVWSDFWVNSKSGVLTSPGTTGYFENGVGLFVADEEHEGKPVKIRGMWDRITPRSCRWSQALSRDGGKTWEDDWVMEWARTSTT